MLHPQSTFFFKVILLTQTKLPQDRHWSGDVLHHTDSQTPINVLFNMSGFRPNLCKTGNLWPRSSRVLSPLNEFNPSLRFCHKDCEVCTASSWSTLKCFVSHTDYWFSLFRAQVNQSLWIMQTQQRHGHRASLARPLLGKPLSPVLIIIPLHFTSSFSPVDNI